MIDLHVHSSFSDGYLTPRELVQRAVSLGLHAIALTDHDCTFGVPELMEAARTEPIEAVPGVEISVDVKKGTFHLLGYYMDCGDTHLEAVLERIRSGREVRNQEIFEKLRSHLNLDIEWSEVLDIAGDGVVGRPHFAEVLIRRGVVRNKPEAFARYLAKGKPMYVDRYRLSPADAINAIRGAGGVAVLAHPRTLDLQGKRLEAYVSELKDLGLQGMEVFYSEHSDDVMRDLLALSRRLELIATGGSDFHGGLNVHVELGRGFGSLHVPDEVITHLKAATRQSSCA